MAANQEIIKIEGDIAGAIRPSALKAFNLGCTGIRIGFSPSGGLLVECYLPVSRVDCGEVDKPTFAELMDDAAKSIIEAKKMLVSTSPSDDDWAAYGNLSDQVEALDKWLNDDREDEEGQPADFDPETTEDEDEEGQPVDFDPETAEE